MAQSRTRRKAIRAPKTPAWRQFELDVAAAYEDLGAIDVVSDVNIEGNQLDVFARVPAVDMTYHRTIISCKYYDRTVGVDEVREWHLVFQALLAAKAVDTATIVTQRTFTRPAQELATLLGIHLTTFDKLRWACVDFRPYLSATAARFKKDLPFKTGRYIPLRLRQDQSNDSQDAAELVRAFLSGGNTTMLNILGDFGVGKTTFCKALFLEYADRFLRDLPNAAMPVYLNLRNYPGQLNMRSFILDTLVGSYGGRCRNFGDIHRLLTAGRIFLLLDLKPAYPEAVSG